METFFNHLFGSHGAAFNFAASIFVILGAMITILIDAYTRNKNSERSPVSWDWSFYLKDNFVRYILCLIIAFVVVRFWSDITDMSLKMWHCLLIGLCFDMMFIVVKQIRKYFRGIIDKHLKL